MFAVNGVVIFVCKFLICSPKIFYSSAYFSFFIIIIYITYTVEPVLKDRPIGHKNMVSRQVVFGDRFIYIEMCDLPKTSGPSRQVVSQDRFHCIYIQYIFVHIQ